MDGTCKHCRMPHAFTVLCCHVCRGSEEMTESLQKKKIYMILQHKTNRCILGNYKSLNSSFKVINCMSAACHLVMPFE